MRYILTDIEGTTSSVAFVYDTLFSYFKSHITDFLNKSEASDLAPHLQAVQKTVLEEGGEVQTAGQLAEILIEWTNADRKHPALKAVQGKVWRSAYEMGKIKGHVYLDVFPALERWRQAGIGLGVYSSGSVEAQQLLFAHSVFGDLTPFFSHYFDTKVGLKREVRSYQAIAETLQLPPSDILFLSDLEAELDAAEAAGMQTIQLVRSGTEPSIKHRIVADFSVI